MEDSTALTGVETEQVVPTDEIEATETDLEPGDQNLDEGLADGEGEATEVEEIEFSFGGNTLKVPKDSIPEEIATRVDEFSKGLWSDYTKRSQGLAEQTKQIEARQTAVDRLVNLQGEAHETYSIGLRLQQELAQLQQINLQELWQSNPDQARQYSDLIQTKNAELQQVAAKVSQQEAQFQQAQQQEIARRSEEGKQTVERYVPGFAEKAPEVIEYAMKTYGVSQEAADQWSLDPISAVLAYKAMLYDRMQTEAKKPAQPTQTGPVQSLKGGGGTNSETDPTRMSMDQYVKWREGQAA